MTKLHWCILIAAQWMLTFGLAVEYNKDALQAFDKMSISKQVLAKNPTGLKVKKQGDDCVTAEELEEEVSALTAMIDMLSVKLYEQEIRINEQDAAITEVQENRIKRCETGYRELYCVDTCCYFDRSSTCVTRGGSVMHWDVQFSQSFDTVPFLCFSVVNNYNVRVESVSDPYYRGYWYSVVDSSRTTSGFTYELQAGNLDYSYYEAWYTISWIACE